MRSASRRQAPDSNRHLPGVPTLIRSSISNLISQGSDLLSAQICPLLPLSHLFAQTASGKRIRRSTCMTRCPLHRDAESDLLCELRTKLSSKQRRSDLRGWRCRRVNGAPTRIQTFEVESWPLGYGRGRGNGQGRYEGQRWHGWGRSNLVVEACRLLGSLRCAVACPSGVQTARLLTQYRTYSCLLEVWTLHLFMTSTSRGVSDRRSVCESPL